MRNFQDSKFGTIVHLILVGYTKTMPSYYSDTHPRMEAMQVKLLRETPPWRKMEMLAELNLAARELALAGIRQRYPEADEAELLRRLAIIILGPDAAREVNKELTDRE